MATVDVSASLQHVEHALRSGNQTALRKDLASASPPVACQMLQAFSLCASAMTDSHIELVDAILRLPWREDAQLASAVCEFVQDLVTAHPSFLRVVVGSLVESFLIEEGPEAPSDAEGSGGSELEEQEI